MKIHKFLLFGLILLLASACEGFLDEKPNKSLVLPTSLGDLRAILDNNATLNTSPPALILATDEYITTDQGFNGYLQWIQRAYTFQRNLLEADDSMVEWWQPYLQILTANIVLEQLQKIPRTPNNGREWDEIYGSALFQNSWSYYNLASLFAQPYSIHTGPHDALGVALKSTSNLGEKISRISLKESYDMILGLLVSSLEYLPESVAYKTRPSKASAAALLARVNLSIEDYEKALEYAEMALAYTNELMDYNTLNEANLYSFGLFNEEVIYYAVFSSTTLTTSQLTFVEPGLLESYGDTDLRKTLFFKQGSNGMKNFFGSYSGSNWMFTGLATNELYLIKAECEARKNNYHEAKIALGTMLQKRFISGTYQMPDLGDDEVLAYILGERKKELAFRGLRWTDLRRLNRDPMYQVEITRVVHGETYTLPPNDPRYVYQIPHLEIELSNIEQNIR